MTIEEALIKSEFGMTYTDEEHDQIIKWLKELRHYQLGECMNDCEHYDNCSNYIYSKGYDKAIDDLVEKIKDEAETKWFFDLADEEGLQILIEKINRIVEQLKSRTKL